MFNIFSLFKSNLNSNDLIRSSKELEKITKDIQRINNKDTFIDKIISKKHALSCYILSLSIIYFQVRDSLYRNYIMGVFVLIFILWQMYFVNPLINYIHLKQLTKLKNKHSKIINNLKDRSNFEKINHIINRFTFGEEGDQDYKSVLDDDIEDKLTQLKALNEDINKKKSELNTNNKKNRKNLLTKFLDNIEQTEDEKILMESLVQDNVQKHYLEYEFKCGKCGKETTFYINKKDAINKENTIEIEVKRCLKC
ncbi:uncharacterized protein HGUI_02675 [Hanseniaspora guilliermondii]|uniref:Endoplasmic reticulum junction formation protein lunapark n=1 Tax=Hanseniaspora guilliermondii TaxID=56406 RepID=A0A1L0B5Z4_9ASCO|nr:uncharacterized protein HGUI_02675 [Hanseniaspora guilliermondii]